MSRIRLIEIFLIQFLIYLALWLSDDYVATLVTVLMTTIFLGILIVAAIAELIEKSKVPKSYFIFMIGSIVIPVIVGFIFVGIMGGQLDWLK